MTVRDMSTADCSWFRPVLSQASVEPSRESTPKATPNFMKLSTLTPPASPVFFLTTFQHSLGSPTVANAAILIHLIKIATSTTSQKNYQRLHDQSSECQQDMKNPGGDNSGGGGSRSMRVSKSSSNCVE